MRGRRFHYRGRPFAWGPLVLVAALIAALIGLDIAMRPYVSSVVAYEAKNYAAATICTAVQNELKSGHNSYTDLVKVSRSADGTIQSITSNVEKQNTLQAELTQTIQHIVENQSHTTVKIPIGTLSGSSLLHGRGIGVPLDVTFSGSVQTQLKSSFSSAGINQTCHRLLLHVTVGLYTYMIGKDADQTASMDIPVAETVIVGAVPTVALQQALKGT